MLSTRPVAGPIHPVRLTPHANHPTKQWERVEQQTQPPLTLLPSITADPCTTRPKLEWGHADLDWLSSACYPCRATLFTAGPRKKLRLWVYQRIFLSGAGFFGCMCTKEWYILGCCWQVVLLAIRKPCFGYTTRSGVAIASGTFTPPRQHDWPVNPARAGLAWHYKYIPYYPRLHTHNTLIHSPTATRAHHSHTHHKHTPCPPHTPPNTTGWNNAFSYQNIGLGIARERKNNKVPFKVNWNGMIKTWLECVNKKKGQRRVNTGLRRERGQDQGGLFLSIPTVPPPRPPPPPTPTNTP